VQVALDARDLLQSHGIPARVVSMPSVEWFAAQDLAYRDAALPPGIRVRVSVEAGSAAAGKRSSVTPTAASACNTTAPPLTTRPCTAGSASLPPPHERASATPRTAPGRETPPRHLGPGRRRHRQPLWRIVIAHMSGRTALASNCLWTRGDGKHPGRPGSVTRVSASQG
jgi:hypothetical protein